MRLSGLVHINRKQIKEIEGRHFMSFWDAKSLICLEDEMIYDAQTDDYYLPRYILHNNLVLRCGQGLICI